MNLNEYKYFLHYYEKKTGYLYYFYIIINEKKKIIFLKLFFFTDIKFETYPQFNRSVLLSQDQRDIIWNQLYQRIINNPSLYNLYIW